MTCKVRFRQIRFMAENRGQRIKVSMIGDSGVGKTSLANKEIYGNFDYAVMPTIGTSHLIAHETVDGVDVEMCLWDTAGQEKYQSLAPLYTRDSDVVIVVASITDHLSVQNISKWINMLKETNKCPNFIIAINKMDVKIDDVDSILDPIRAEYENVFLVSAKTGDGVQELFYHAAKEGYSNSSMDTPSNQRRELVVVESKKSCCY